MRAAEVRVKDDVRGPLGRRCSYESAPVRPVNALRSPYRDQCGTKSLHQFRLPSSGTHRTKPDVQVPALREEAAVPIRGAKEERVFDE